MPNQPHPVMHVACALYPPLGYVGVCGQHGQLPTYWTHPTLAAFDLLGHATHFHSRPLPANLRNDVPCT